MAKPCTVEELSWCGFPSMLLDNGLLRAIIVPRLGGKIASLINLENGREWLWKNPMLQPRVPDFGASYSGEFDLGGWDECFPSQAASYYPSGPWEGIPIPDHGELWALPWKAKLQKDPEQTELRTVSYGVRSPYRFERVIRMRRGEPRLQIGYSVNNLSIFPQPFIWSAHPILQVQPGARISVGTTQVAVFSSVEDRFGHLGTLHSWPKLKDKEGKTWDFSTCPPEKSGVAVKLYGRSPSDGVISVQDPDIKTEFRIEFNPTEVTHVGLWLNFGGWSGAVGVPPYYNIGLQPCIGAQDDLMLAYDHFKEYGLISPHGIRSWRIEVSLK